jgi:hypothetical protein
MKRTVIVITPDRHKRFKKQADSLGLKVFAAANQAVDLWMSSHNNNTNTTAKSLQK